MTFRRLLRSFATFLPITIPCALAALAANLPSQGQNGPFDTESFEGHRYTLGNLAGIDMWSGQDHWMIFDNIALIPNLAAARVQNTHVRSGTQAVTFDASLLSLGCFGELRRNAFFAQVNGVVEHEMDFFIETAPIQSEWEFYSQVAPHPGSCQIRWWMEASGRVVLMTGPSHSVIFTNHFVTKDVWHHARTIIDNIGNTTSVYIDGVLVVTGTPMITGLAGHGFSQVNAYGAGNDRIHIDNWRVRERVAEHGLNVDPKRLPVSQRTALTFRLAGGPALANRAYALVGSASGTAPGTPIGPVTLPLVVDGFFWLVVGQLGSPGLPGFLGTMNPDGSAEAELDTVIPVPAAFLGLRFDFAYLTMSPIDAVSEPMGATVTLN